MNRRTAALARALPLLLGVVAGALLVGLLLPVAVDERPAESPTAVSSAPGAGARPDAARAGDAAPPPGEGATAGPAAPAPSEGAPGAASPGSTPTTAAAAPGTAAPTSAGATDVGVTPTEIRVGAVLLKAGGLDQVGQAVGLPPVQEQQAVVQAYIDDINEAGGIHGRRLVASYAPVDVLDQASERAACLALARDAKVFAVVGTFVSQPGTLCVTREHRRPLVNPGLVSLDETLQASSGLLFTLHQRAGRLVANMVAHLTAAGTLGGHRIGIVTSESVDPGAKLATQTQALLRGAGHTAPEMSRLSADLSVAASQMPIEVRRMQAAGVDLVVLLAPGLLSTQFVQQADRQRYLPAYVATDFGPMSPDTSVQNMPRSFDGAHLVTATNGADANVGGAPNADAAACRAVLERRTPFRYEVGSNAEGLSQGLCASVASLASGLQAAGTSPSAGGFSAGLQSAPRAPMMTPSWGGGAFSRGKFDLADLIRTQRFAFDCRCWKPTGPFRPPYA